MKKKKYSTYYLRRSGPLLPRKPATVGKEKESPRTRTMGAAVVPVALVNACTHFFQREKKTDWKSAVPLAVLRRRFLFRGKVFSGFFCRSLDSSETPRARALPSETGFGSIDRVHDRSRRRTGQNDGFWRTKRRRRGQKKPIGRPAGAFYRRRRRRRRRWRRQYVPGDTVRRHSHDLRTAHTHQRRDPLSATTSPRTHTLPPPPPPPPHAFYI